MKKIPSLIVIPGLCFLLPLFAQQEEDYVKTRESVSVTHVEVPVRVFFDGKPVDHLQKSEFKLYEGKKLQTVHGFYIKRKKINLADSKPPARYFVLVFRVLDYHREFKRGVDYVFDNILRPDDQVLVFANEQTLFFKDLKNRTKIRQLVHRILKEQAKNARNLLTLYFQKVKDQLNYTKLELAFTGGSGPHEAGRLLDNFLNRYLLLWKEYKRRYLLPDLNTYYNFARHLEKIKKEKWAINFYQIELFPQLKFSGRMRKQIEDFIDGLVTGRPEDQVLGRLLNDLLQKVDRELAVAQDFPADEVSKLFYKVDTTFHSIFMNTSEKDADEDLDIKRVATDLENSLREITEKTGGGLIATRDLRSALSEVSHKEDIYYMLTYRPEDPQQIGKIRVEVNNKKYHVLYDNNMRADYIREYLEKRKAENPAVQIDRAEFQDKKLNLVLSNFLMKSEGKESRGKLKVRIRIKDSQNRMLYDQAKTISAQKDSIRLSVGFNWLKRGTYDVVVDARDLFTGKGTVDFLQPEIR